MNIDTITQIKNLVEENGTVMFDESLDIHQDSITGVDYDGDVIGEEGYYMLEDLTENELDELLIHLEDQIESNNKLMERCRSYNW